MTTAARGQAGMVGPFRIDFISEEEPVALTVAGPINLCPGWKLIGDGLAETDSGLVLLDAVNGVGRLTTTNEASHAAIVASNLCYKPSVNGHVRLEARVSLQALTARRAFIGICDELADAEDAVLTGSTATLTLTQSDLAGFFFDSGLTDTDWHCVHNGGSVAGVTDATALDTGTPPVAGEFDVMWLDVYPDGTVEWWLNEERVKRLEGAIDPDVLFGFAVGVFATTTTIADLDADYAEYGPFGRHWDRDNA